MPPRKDDPPRRRPRVQSGQGAEVRYRHGNVVNFASSDYLGYALDPRLAQAAIRSAHRYGVGAGASPLTSGFSPPLQALERDLAAWEGTEAAVVFASDLLRDAAVCSTLVGENDALFLDAANRAGLHDVARISRAAVHVYRHADTAHLDEQLSLHRATRRFVVSESVFRDQGDLADLPGLLDVARRHSAILILDESHATGVLGEHGRGLTDQVEADETLLKLGSLSHALGAEGGYVCGSRRLIDSLVSNARPYHEAHALAPPLAAAARRAVFLVGAEPERRRHMLALAGSLRHHLGTLALDVGGSASQIVSVKLDNARRVCRRLADRIFLTCHGESSLTIRLSAGHTQDDVHRLVEALRPGGSVI
jgi:8-amino-7-oxononanoate synthase